MFRDAFTILDPADVGRLSAFYVDHLGVKPGYRWPGQGEGDLLRGSLDAFSIGLSKTDSLAPSGRTAFWLHTDDVDREIERLRAHGVAVIDEPVDTEWGERMTTVSDPDGNLVHIGQRGGDGRSTPTSRMRETPTALDNGQRSPHKLLGGCCREAGCRLEALERSARYRPLDADSPY
jgi:catechol 2,3-dioxygenase-like lactoylglutathione lyase family enzyme